MSLKNLRVVLVAALVAALLGSGVATARTLIKSKDIASSAVTSAKIKNGSILDRDIKNGTISLSKLSAQAQRTILETVAAVAKGNTGPAGPAGAKGADGAKGEAGAKGADGAAGAKGETGAKGADGAAGAKGETGAKGADGTNGTNGAKGDKGDKGDTGASFDPTKVTAQTSLLYGFTPWYDTDDDASTVEFTATGLKLTAPTGRVGVNLPIARGSSLSTLKSLTYTQTGKAVLAIELYYRGGIFEYGKNDGTEDKTKGTYRNDYTTVRFEPTADGDVPNVLSDTTVVTSSGAIGPNASVPPVVAGAPTTWGAIKAAIVANGVRGDATNNAANAKANLDAAIVLGVTLRTPGSSTSTTPTTATVTKVGVQLRNGPALAFGFGS